MSVQHSSQEFLDKFTKEIILHVKAELERRESERLEAARIRNAIAVEKLKQKFAEYGEKKSEPKVIEIIRPVVQPAPALKALRPVKVVPLPPPHALGPDEIDFGKIIGFVRDPLVTYIECPGENKNVIIKRAGEIVKTQLTLLKDEILKIVSSFSEKARIPLIEGMLTARAKNLEISAVVSEITTPSFILKKIFMPPREGPSMLEKPVLPAPGIQKPIVPMPPVARPFPQAQFQGK